MFDRFFFSSALRTAALFALTSLTATSLALGGCVGEHQIGDGTGGSAGATAAVGGDFPPESGTTKPGDNTPGTVSSSASSGSGSGSNSGGGATTGPVNYSVGQITELMPQVQTHEWLAPGESLDSSTSIMVFLLEGGQSCGSPISNFGTSKSHHELIVGLPRALFKVGKYDFSSSDVIAFGDTWLTDGMGNGGGGKSPLQAGTIEILSIDVYSAIKVRIEGLTQDLSLLNGEFAVKPCLTD